MSLSCCQTLAELENIHHWAWSFATFLCHWITNIYYNHLWLKDTACEELLYLLGFSIACITSGKEKQIIMIKQRKIRPRELTVLLHRVLVRTPGSSSREMLKNWGRSRGGLYSCYSWACGLLGEVDFPQSGREKAKGDEW